MTTKLDEPATGKQLRAVALLCLKHNIKEYLEDRPMTKGEAGRLIRHLTNTQAINKVQRDYVGSCATWLE